MKPIEPSENSGKSGEHPEQGKLSITIGDKTHQVRPGVHRGADLKALGEIPNEYEFDQIKDGEFIEIKDEDKIKIEGGEVFVGRPKKGHSS